MHKEESMNKPVPKSYLGIVIVLGSASLLSFLS